MLRDPHHDLNLTSFRDYAASKEPDEMYDYFDRNNCACAQFSRHIGLFEEWEGAELDTQRWPWARLNYLAKARLGGLQEWGALLKRIDAEIAGS